jgi:hypothetical protein
MALKSGAAHLSDDQSHPLTCKVPGREYLDDSLVALAERRRNAEFCDLGAIDDILSVNI